MPYTKEHKEQTRKRILQSAFQLFTSKGFDGVTVNKLMENCKLTRGAFYAHFASKTALYTESIKYAASNSILAEHKSNNVSDKKWLGQLLDGYLSIEHVKGKRPCPLAFLATDMVTKDSESKLAYAHAYTGMNESIMAYAKTYTNCTTNDILALTAMIIGAVAISRTIADEDVIDKLLTSCRKEAGLKLGGI
jgi:AcrR family transcriptional regulator